MLLSDFSVHKVFMSLVWFNMYKRLFTVIHLNVYLLLFINITKVLMCTPMIPLITYKNAVNHFALTAYPKRRNIWTNSEKSPLRRGTLNISAVPLTEWLDAPS